MKLRQKDLIGITKRTMFLVVPLLVLFLMMFYFYEDSLEDQAALLLSTEQEKGSEIIRIQLEAEFSQFVSDLLLVTDSAEFQRYLRYPGEYNSSELEQLFLRIANKKPYINHIRFIDDKGMEIMKVDHFPNTLAYLSEPSSLQDRSDSELVEFARNHDPTTLYVSPISLDSRQSYEDGHEKAALVLGLPAYQEGEFFGMVVVDYDACFLLSFLRDYQHSMAKDIRFGLVSDNGEWIQQGELPCSEALQEGRAGSSLFDEAPALASHLFAEDSGSYIAEGTSYSFDAVKSPANIGLSLASDTGRLWSVVSYYSLADLPELAQILLLQHPSIKWLFALLILLLAWVFLAILHLRKTDRLQLEVSSLISEYSGNGIMVIDESRRINYCNQAFEVLCGYTKDELIGKDTHGYLPPIDMDRNGKKDEEPVSKPIWVRHKNGNRFLTNRILIKAKTNTRKGGYTVGVYTSSAWDVSSFVDHAREDRLRLLPVMLAGKGGELEASYCLLIQLKHKLERDLHYSLITESAFSTGLSEFIASRLNQSEPVYAFSLDTYVVLLHEDSPERVKDRIKGLLLGIENEYASFSKLVQNQAICGYSHNPGGPISISKLLLEASMATKMIEDSGKHQCLLFDENVHNQYLRKQAILNEIPRALNSSSLSLYYQAQLDVASNRIVGAEALIRWIHPELGFIAPDEFIPLMEEHYMISMLGEFVIRSAVTFLKNHQKFLLSVEPNFSLAINLSAEEFSSQSFIDFIRDELKEHDVDPALLTVELTERTAVGSLQTTDMFMKKLHSIGVGISIDDFGSGFSSLSYLMELSMDEIKIDRSFLESYPDDDAITIYKTVLLLAKELGVTVIAEGVESEEQLAFLKQIGCNRYQGYYFSKAIPEAEFLEQMRG